MSHNFNLMLRIKMSEGDMDLGCKFQGFRVRVQEQEGEKRIERKWS